MTTARVARSFEEVEELRPAWELLHNGRVTSDLDFMLTYCRHTAGVIRPHVVLVEEDGKPVALLPDKDGTPSPLVRNVFFTERKGGKKAEPGKSN